MSDDNLWWLNEIGPEWAGHTWRAHEVSAIPSLLAEARVWADDPDGVLYIHADSLRMAYGLAVAVAQRAGQTIRERDRADTSPLAVGLLDEVSIPGDPDPDSTEIARLTRPEFSAADTHFGFRYEYAARLAEAPLALLRLPSVVERDVEYILDQIASERWNHKRPTVLASVVRPDQVSVAYGERVAWRLGFALPDGTPIGFSKPHAAVLDVDHPPH